MDEVDYLTLYLAPLLEAAYDSLCDAIRLPAADADSRRVSTDVTPISRCAPMGSPGSVRSA